MVSVAAIVSTSALSRLYDSVPSFFFHACELSPRLYSPRNRLHQASSMHRRLLLLRDGLGTLCERVHAESKNFYKLRLLPAD